MTYANTYLRNALYTLLCVVLISSCTTSKSLMKDGLKYQQTGMNLEAVNAFKSSLSKNMNNMVSREGLERAGQSVLNGYLDEFNRNAMMNRTKESVYAFKKAQSFNAEVKKFGVDLTIPDHYYQSYASTEESYLSGRYEEGIAKLEVDDFIGSKAIFDEILSIHPGYRDVESLKGTSVLEPKYRRALEEMDQGEFRRAYYTFDNILKTSSYKDAGTLRKQCIEQGTFVMAILPFENHTGQPSASGKVQAYALDRLVNMNNPFLRVVDRQNLNQVLAEQNFSLSGVIDGNTAVEVGNLVGAKALLIGEVMDYREEMGKMRRVQMNGYESYTIKEKGEDGQEKISTRYKPVVYNQYSDKNRVSLSFHMKLISLETGEVLLSDVIEKQFNDEIAFATYNGDSNKLFPQVNGRPDVSKSAMTNLQGLMTARTELQSIGYLSNQAYVQAAEDLSRRIEEYLNQ